MRDDSFGENDDLSGAFVVVVVVVVVVDVSDICTQLGSTL